MGLPPRGRGRGRYSRLLGVRLGITPAWAGKSFGYQERFAEYRDYPRVGGEENAAPSVTKGQWGLPPRGRGRGLQRSARCAKRRITPAWAGKSLVSCEADFRRWDYPRVGGEEYAWCARYRLLGGLPPRGRGRVKQTVKIGNETRITPAWAGKSRNWRIAARPSWDYPRVGGEEWHSVAEPGMRPGLPPRGRGRDFPLRQRVWFDRITPAWAGKSA